MQCLGFKAWSLRYKVFRRLGLVLPSESARVKLCAMTGVRSQFPLPTAPHRHMVETLVESDG